MSANRVMLVILVAGLVVLAVGVGPRIADTARALPSEVTAAPPDVTIPYPGRLSDDSGQPVLDGVYDFAFTLYAAEGGGEPLWSEVQEGVPVQAGEFVVSLGSVNPIPAATLAGDGRWLAVAVRGPAEAAFTALAPRQRVSTAAPAAPSSPAAGGACPHDHFGERWIGSSFTGLAVSSDTGFGSIQGLNRGSGIGIVGFYSPTGIEKWDENEIGVYGWSGTGHGVYGLTDGDWSYHSGVYGKALKDNANGVTGRNTAAGPGVYGWSTDGFGVYAMGKEEENFPLYRKGDLMLAGSYGDLFATGLLRLISDSSVSVRIDLNNDGSDGFYIYNGAGQPVLLADEAGNLWIAGTLTEGVTDAQIDHPQVPENRTLPHSSVASPDMKNVYDGVVVLDAEGTAWVELPAGFEALNRDFCYQLTPIGGPGPGLYIEQEIQGNRFQIAGGEPGLKVSWQVTGVRHDAYAEALPIEVEEEKPEGEQSTHLHPVEHGMPETLSLESVWDGEWEGSETGSE